MKLKGIFAVIVGMAVVLGGCGDGTKECAHVWGTWTAETAPTCTEEGVEKRTCSECGQEERQKVSATGHQWGTWKEVRAPSCKEDGLQERECEGCHEKETKPVDALGHAQGVWISDGEGHWQECPVCGEALSQKELHVAENGTCTVCGGESVGLEYAVYDTECHVIGIGTESGDIVIPATYCGKPVTEIGEGAFYYEDITSVVIPDSVIYIRRIAFYQCSALRRVQLGNSVKEIGEQAFHWDRALSDIELPASLQSIGDSAFRYCAFTEIGFPDSLQCIGQEAFGSSALQTVTLPANVTELGERIFYQCKSLQSIRFESGFKAIPADICYGCSILSSVTLPNGLETVGRRAFANCPALTQVSIPASVHTLGEGTFQYSGLTEVTIPDSVETFENAVFYNCKSLVRAVIGNGVTSIGKNEAFGGVGMFEECSMLNDLTIGSGVNTIASRAFQGCALLTRITYRGTTEAWKGIEKGGSIATWRPTVKQNGLWTSVLEEVVCLNGSLKGADMG